MDCKRNYSDLLGGGIRTIKKKKKRGTQEGVEEQRRKRYRGEKKYPERGFRVARMSEEKLRY